MAAGSAGMAQEDAAVDAAVFAGIERDLVKKYRSLYPAQKQAVRMHMDQHFDPLREDSEVHFNELLKNALDAEMPFFSAESSRPSASSGRRGRVRRESKGKTLVPSPP